MTIWMSILFSFLISFSVLADPQPEQPDQSQPPVGETAFYELDKNRARTSGLIRSGTFDIEVAAYRPDAEDGPSFDLKMNYNLKPAVGSARKGTKEIVVPEEYFNDEFMARLREEKEVVTPSFTVRHEGFEDATLISGEVYTNCDKILIYDVKSNKDSFLYNLIESLIDINDVAEGEVRSDLEDAELRAHITSEIDAFGAAKIDLKGKSNGINIIAGFDFLHH